jgi:DNA-binding MarR family transcriptional regulator
MLRYAAMKETELHFSENFMRCIHRTVYALDKLADRILEAEKGLTFSQFMIMIAVERIPKVSQKTIAEFLDVTEAAVSRHIGNLVKKELINRHVNPKSRREHVLRLTERGKREFDGARTILRKELDEFFQNIGEKDRKNIIRIFDAILKEAKECRELHITK